MLSQSLFIYQSNRWKLHCSFEVYFNINVSLDAEQKKQFVTKRVQCPFNQAKVESKFRESA